MYVIHTAHTVSHIELQGDVSSFVEVRTNKFEI